MEPTAQGQDVPAHDHHPPRKWPSWFSLVHICPSKTSFLPSTYHLLHTQLTISSIAVTIPVILCRRYRVSRHQRLSLPPRRAGNNAFTPSIVPLGPPSASASHAISQQDTFNGPLYAAKALGIATAIVISGGAATVWMVKTSLGVNTVRFNLETSSSSSFFFLQRYPTLVIVSEASSEPPCPRSSPASTLPMALKHRRVSRRKTPYFGTRKLLKGACRRPTRLMVWPGGQGLHSCSLKQSCTASLNGPEF